MILNLCHALKEGGCLTADFYVQAQTLHFLNQNVERLGGSRLERVITLDNGFVNSSPSLHVIRFNGEQFLQSIGGSVSFQRPHLHFTKTLATVLRLPAEWLLGNKRIGSDSASMNLIRYEVPKFHHIDVTNHHFLIEGIAGTSVEKLRLTTLLHPGEPTFFPGVL